MSVCVCGQVDKEDKYVYIGTTSGDVVVINIAMQKLRGVLPPVKKRFNKGVKAIGQFKSGEFVVGAGDGVVCLCDPQFNRTAYVPRRGYGGGGHKWGNCLFPCSCLYTQAWPSLFINLTFQIF